MDTGVYTKLHRCLKPLEIGPGRPIQHLDAATQKAILAAADTDFVEGIRFSLATAMVFLTLVLAAGFAWFPRGSLRAVIRRGG